MDGAQPMKTIDLKKYYYPICLKEALVELPDEVADAIAEAARTENANDAKQHYHCYSLDASPGIENHSPEQAASPEDILMEEETEREQEAARAYVENWKEAYKNNAGLLLFGDVGTGKSFFAGCIANALLDRDVPVLMTNFPTILNRLTGMFSEDRAAFIASLDEYDLLIIDDLGVERSTDYAMEQMFFVIDSRYRSRRPMIITTNLKLSELKNPSDLPHARIYDRILERCAPILFDGKNFREENAGAAKVAAKDLVNRKSE